MITTIIILNTIVSLVFIFTTWNLLRKNEATEDIVEEQENTISEIAQKIDKSMEKLKDLDTKGAFEADDETGTIFKQMYEIIEDLEKYYGQETKETK
jgi:hypothetical protein